VKKGITSIILSIVILIIEILGRWFRGWIDINIPLYGILLAPTFLIFLLTALLMIILSLVDEKSKSTIIAVIVYLVVILCMFIPVEEIQIKANLYFNKDKYQEAVELVKKRELNVDKNTIELPKQYKELSINNKLIIYNTNPMIIGFFYYEGFMLSNSTILIYIESDNSEELNNPFPHIKELKRLDECWYYLVD